jgi:peptide/nickel transport system ATP-binding protein
MYMGRIVEVMPKEFFLTEDSEHLHHPYTRYLMDAVPVPDPKKKTKLKEEAKKERIDLDEKEGCPFSPRCTYALDKCRESMPPLTKLAFDHYIACYKLQESASS